MNTYVVLLRGINVGGKNLLPMKELKGLLESAGYENIKTYIQSGNIVLNSAENPERDIKKRINDKFGISPEVMVMTANAFTVSAASNPYQHYEAKCVHCYFCKDEPNVDATKLQKLTSASESYELIGKLFYLYAPDGIGRSKLVANIDSCLGVPATGRNLNTINKLKAMLETA